MDLRRFWSDYTLLLYLSLNPSLQYILSRFLIHAQPYLANDPLHFSHGMFCFFCNFSLSLDNFLKPLVFLHQLPVLSLQYEYPSLITAILKCALLRQHSLQLLFPFRFLNLSLNLFLQSRYLLLQLNYLCLFRLQLFLKRECVRIIS